MTATPRSPILIYNNHAGQQRTDQPTAAQLSDLFSNHELNVDIREVDGNSLMPTIESAVRENPHLIIAAGGDGTISATATALVGSSINLGVLPFGTLNHFARDCGIPTELESAIALIAGESPRPVDVGEVNGRVFINNASVGIYPKTVRLREGLSSRLGGNKWLAMFLAGLRMFGRFPTYDVSVRTDEETIEVRTPLVFIGNNEYSIDLFDLGSRRSLDDGKLHLLTADGAGRLRMAWLAVRSILSPEPENGVIKHRLASELTLTTKKQRVRIALDGEVFQMNAPLQFKSRPGALKVVRPVKNGGEA